MGCTRSRVNSPHNKRHMSPVANNNNNNGKSDIGGENYNMLLQMKAPWCIDH
jgi:hypothetical protein